MPDKLPPHIRAQIEDFKRKSTHNEALSKEYRDQYSRVHTPNQPTYEQWLKDNGKQKMAKGGAFKHKKVLQGAERKANLDKFLEDSQIKDKMYRGATPHFYKEGIPIFVAPTVRFAEKFPVGSLNKSNAVQQNQTIFPLHVNATNPFDYTNPEQIKKVIYQISKSDPELAEKIENEFSYYQRMAEKFGDQHNNWGLIERPHVQDAIKQLGHDSFYVNEEGVKNLGVFNPNQLKSAIGNRGTYDPNDPDITKAKGGMVHMSQGGSDDDYRGSHTAPDPHFGAPMHNVAQGMYPEDFYGPMGQSYYANEGWDFDRDAYNKVMRVKNKPNEMVSVYRAVPTSVYKEALKKDAPLKHMIRKGDWVAIHKDYAKSHGESALNGDYKIASMRVPARHVWTNGDSIHEWGYHPDEPVKTKAKGGDVNIKEMRDYILQHEGTYGAKRLERAADEIPNLEKMYSPQALKEAFSGDNARVIATINPKDFERYAMPLPMNLAMNKAYHSDKAVKPTMRQAFMDSGLTDQQWQELNDYQRADLFDKYNAKISKMAVNRPMSYDQYIKHLAKIKGGFAQVPFLQLDKQEQGLPIVPHITGHEGRHRNRALFHKGVEKSLVTLEPRAELREGFPRRERGEYLDALKKEMEMTNNMVRPEDEEEYGKSQIIRHRRSPIQLPDFYAVGGKVSLLRKHGLPTSSIEDAQRKLGEGHLVFVAHEQDEHPREVRSVSEFHGYVPDQIYTVHPKHFMQKKADGGDVQGKTMTPDLAKMRIELAQNSNPIQMDSIGVNEAMDIKPKVFMSPTPLEDTKPSVGGTQIPKLGPMGGIDMNPNQSGQQLMPAPQQAPGGLPGASAGPSASPSIPQGPTPPMGNMLSMTPQGQAMQAMGGGQPQPQSMASGGRAKPKFGIAPAKAPAPMPKHFTPYDHENPTMGSLAKAFDEAIAHHLSLHPEARAANSIRASEALAEHIGRNRNNGAKDLLGKNAKLIKSEKGEEEAIKLPDGRGVETTGLALAPAFEKGKFNTCPNSHSCKAECLGKTSGNYFKLGGGKDLSEFKGPRLNSLRKTLGFIHDPHSFAVKLHDEISDAKAIAAQNNNHLGVRLNVLSDINPRVHKSIIEAHPDVTFYDYTKNNTDPIAPNHHYTYSSTGVSQHGVDNPHSNWKQMRRRLNGGDNVAMAFTHKKHLPEHIHDEETGKKYRVVNGDTHDFRPLDLQPEGEEGVIVGLKNKKATGKMKEAHLDSNGFFVHYDPALKMAKSEKTGSPIYARDKKGNTIAQNKDVRIKPQTGGMIPITNDDGGKA